MTIYWDNPSDPAQAPPGGKEGLQSAAVISAPRNCHLFFSGSLLDFPRESLPPQLYALLGTVPAAERSDPCLFFCLLFL